ncbi:SusD/RagB family nutrient-binding outer membrane lipoprotein [Sediminitomix flava]|uniref:SusD-like starch-binding protein associating with outer membrane n=1 Tax=Sediminitomix flava TaxID=379075 RepID=A0A315Z8T7_SEDFL|nr:SusD/RagB family nutrient-binding outer membrane lipoprotein [Sediminitomix flava]PWJ40975.1 SusD-like starch-binding protein associating with outer membrane [Sediminitomix flava]
MRLFNKIVMGIGTAAVLLTSCTKNFEEINTNPNDPENVPTVSLALSGSRVLMDNIRDEWFAGRMVTPWVQYWAQVNYTEEDRFQYRENSNNSTFKALYGTVMDFERIIEIAEDPELSGAYSLAYGNPNNQIQAARIMKAWAFQLITDTYGPVPYSTYGSKEENPDFNALMAHEGVTNPDYVSQERIYADLLNELSEAVAAIDEGERVFDRNIIFERETAASWKKFGNSLRLRIAVQAQKQGVPGAAETIAELANGENLITSNDDNAAWFYDGSTLKGAPMYKAYFVNNRTDFAVAKPLIDLLKGKTSTNGTANPFADLTDPRLFRYAVSVNVDETHFRGGTVEDAQSLDPADYEGIPYGVPSEVAGAFAMSRVSMPGEPVLAADAAEIYIEAAEVYFLLSEINGFDQANYEAGVRASMERWGVESADIDAYIANLPAASEETVLTQKYIALYGQPHQAWSEYRRTGYPKHLIKKGDFTGANYLDGNAIIADAPMGDANDVFFAPLVDIDDLPARVNFAQEEELLNPAGYNQGKALIGEDHQSTTLWIFK